MFEHMYITQGQNCGGMANAQNFGGMANSMGQINPMMRTSPLMGQRGHSSGAQVMQPVGVGNVGAIGAACQEAYLQLIRDSNPEMGLSVSEALPKLGGRFTEAQIQQAHQDLIDQARVYTVDDTHVQVVG
jgi:hypothetical protein